MVKYYSYILLFASICIQCRHKEEPHPVQFREKLEVPSSIKKEHKKLLYQIHGLSLLKDSAGSAAKKVLDLMQHHFTEEEDLVLPLLGLLPLLASGKLPDQINEALKLSEQLESHSIHLGVEHQLIKAYVEELKQLAEKENIHEITEFEMELQKHAGMEEEVLFPAAVLIGEYLKLRSLEN